jgi:hypothetical protein
MILTADIQIGGFDWELLFNWNAVPIYESLRRKSQTDPIRSVRNNSFNIILKFNHIK